MCCDDVCWCVVECDVVGWVVVVSGNVFIVVVSVSGVVLIGCGVDCGLFEGNWFLVLDY